MGAAGYASMPERPSANAVFLAAPNGIDRRGLAVDASQPVSDYGRESGVLASVMRVEPWARGG